MWKEHRRNALVFADLGGPPGRGNDYAMFAISRMGGAALGGFDENFAQIREPRIQGKASLFLCDHWRRLRLSRLPFVRVPVPAIVYPIGENGNGQSEGLQGEESGDDIFAINAEGGGADQDGGEDEDELTRARRIRSAAALSLYERRRRRTPEAGAFWPFHDVPEEGRNFYTSCTAARMSLLAGGVEKLHDLASRR